MQKRRSLANEPNQFVDTTTRECIIAIDPDPKGPEIVPGMRMSVRIDPQE